VIARVIVGTLVALAGTASLAALSHVPWAEDTADHALLRLAWRTRGVQVDECRRLSPAEIAALPAHMRREEVCEGRVLPYGLEVRLDGAVVIDDTVRAAGARADRPLYVNREIALEPGTYHVDVRFRLLGAGNANDETATPASLTFTATLTLARKEIALVTNDADARALVLRGHGVVP